MTGYNDIRDAIMKLLKTAYPTANIYGEEIQQGFKRPAFFVQLVPGASTTINIAHRQKSILADVHYFSDAVASERNRDMWNKAEELDAVFGTTLCVEDRNFFIQDAQPEIVDEVLQYQFNLSFTDSRDDAVVIPGAAPPGETIPDQIILPDPELGYVEGNIVPMEELDVKEEF